MLDTTLQPIGIQRFEESKKALIKAKFSEANPSTVFPKVGLRKESVNVAKNGVNFQFTRDISIAEKALSNKDYLTKITVVEKYLDFTNDIELDCTYEGTIDVALFNEMFTTNNKTKIYDEYCIGEETPLDFLGYMSEDSENITFAEGMFMLDLKTKNKKFLFTNKWYQLIDGKTTGFINVNYFPDSDKEHTKSVLNVDYNAAFKPIEYTRVELVEKESN